MVAGKSVAISPVPQPASSSDEIHGVVRDTDGNPLIGAGVLIAGTNNGTVTDLDGKYRIRASKGSTLVFSCLGYTTFSSVVGNSAVMDVVLEPFRTEKFMTWWIKSVAELIQHWYSIEDFLFLLEQYHHLYLMHKNMMNQKK